MSLSETHDSAMCCCSAAAKFRHVFLTIYTGVLKLLRNTDELPIKSLKHLFVQGQFCRLFVRNPWVSPRHMGLGRGP
jgi:hypothetical protein